MDRVRDEIEQAIVDTLAESKTAAKPSEVFAGVVKRMGEVNHMAMVVALWRLIAWEVIDLSPDRYLTIRANAEEEK